MTAIPEQMIFGHAPTRLGNRDRYVAPGQTFRTRDGDWVQLIAGSEVHFPRLVHVMARDDLLEHPDFATSSARMANAHWIEAIESDWVAWLD